MWEIPLHDKQVTDPVSARFKLIAQITQETIIIIRTAIRNKTSANTRVRTTTDKL